MSTAYTTIQGGTLYQDWPENYGASGTLAIFATSNFTADDNSSFIAGTGESLREEFVTESVITVTGNTGTYASYLLPKTDTCTPNTIRYFAVIFDARGTRRDDYFSNRHLRTSLGDSISELQWALDNQQHITPQPDGAPSTTAMNAAISAAILNAALNQDYVVGSYSTFALAVAAMPATGATLVINQATSVPSNISVPSYVTLRFTGKGYLNLTTGATMTHAGAIEAGPHKIFYNATAGQGTVSFSGNKSISTVFPQWWDAVADGATNSAPAIIATLAALDTLGGGTLDFLSTSSQFVLTSAITIGTATHPVKAILRNNLTSNSSITVNLGSQFVGFAQNPSTPILSYTGSGEFVIMGGSTPVDDEDNRSSLLANLIIQGTYLGKGLGGSTTQKLIVLKNGFSHGRIENVDCHGAAWGMYGVSDGAAIDKNLFTQLAFRNPIRQAVYLKAIATTPDVGFVEMNTFINLVLRNDDSAYPTFQMLGDSATSRVAGSTTFINMDASFAGNDSLGTMFDFTDVSGVQFIGGESIGNYYGIFTHANCRDINTLLVNAQSINEYLHDPSGQAAGQVTINAGQTEFRVGPSAGGRRVAIITTNSSPGDAVVVGRVNAQSPGMMTIQYDSGTEQGLELLNAHIGPPNGKSWRLGDGVGATAGIFCIYDGTDSQLYFSIDGSNGVVAGKSLQVTNMGRFQTVPKTNQTYSNAMTIDVSISNHVIAASNTTSATSTWTPSAAGNAGDWLYVDTVADSSGTVTVTFAATFHSSGTQATTASHFSSIAFKSNGSLWIEQYRTTNLA